jgi:hypothetical protein
MGAILIAKAAGALVGAAAGYFSKKREYKQANEQLDWEQQQNQSAFDYRKKQSDSMFNLQKQKQLEELGLQKNRLAQALGADVQAFNMGAEQQALQAQANRVGLADESGMAQAMQGASGTRGNASTDMKIGFHEGQARRVEDILAQAQSMDASNMMRQYSNSFNDIGREMESWETGGYWMRQKEIGDTYARQMHGLDTEAYNRQRSQLNNGFDKGVSYATSIFGGVKKGLGVVDDAIGLATSFAGAAAGGAG